MGFSVRNIIELGMGLYVFCLFFFCIYKELNNMRHEQTDTIFQKLDDVD